MGIGYGESLRKFLVYTLLENLRDTVITYEPVCVHFEALMSQTR
jgi:hypothetical protein